MSQPVRPTDLESTLLRPAWPVQSMLSHFPTRCVSHLMRSWRLLLTHVVVIWLCTAALVAVSRALDLRSPSSPSC